MDPCEVLGIFDDFEPVFDLGTLCNDLFSNSPTDEERNADRTLYMYAMCAEASMRLSSDRDARIRRENIERQRRLFEEDCARQRRMCREALERQAQPPATSSELQRKVRRRWFSWR